MQAGLIEEMLEDTFEGLEDDDLEEAADTEVEKVLYEITKGEPLDFARLIYSAGVSHRKPTLKLSQKQARSTVPDIPVRRLVTHFPPSPKEIIRDRTLNVYNFRRTTM